MQVRKEIFPAASMAWRFWLSEYWGSVSEATVICRNCLVFLQFKKRRAYQDIFKIGINCRWTCCCPEEHLRTKSFSINFIKTDEWAKAILDFSEEGRAGYTRSLEKLLDKGLDRSYYTCSSLKSTSIERWGLWYENVVLDTLIACDNWGPEETKKSFAPSFKGFWDLWRIIA